MNPLKARTHAVETLMRLCETAEDEKLRLEAATLLLVHTELSEQFAPDATWAQHEEED